MHQEGDFELWWERNKMDEVLKITRGVVFVGFSCARRLRVRSVMRFD